MKLTPPGRPDLTLSHLRKIECHVTRTHLERQGPLLALADEVMELLLDGMQLAGRVRSQTVTAPADLVVPGVFSLAVNTYRKTVDLAAQGYYSLAVPLLRLLGECWITAAYLRLNPLEASRWLDSAGATRKYGYMAEAVLKDEPLNEPMKTALGALEPLTDVHRASVSAASKRSTTRQRGQPGS